MNDEVERIRAEIEGTIPEKSVLDRYCHKLLWAYDDLQERHDKLHALVERWTEEAKMWDLGKVDVRDTLAMRLVAKMIEKHAAELNFLLKESGE